MRRLPLFYSCDRRWSEMEGDGVVRRCHDCERDVVNLSALDEATARTLLDAQAVTACVRYEHARGRIVFARRARNLAVAAAAAVLLGTLPAGADTAPPGPPAPPPTRKHKRDNKRRTPPTPKKAAADDADGGIIMPKF